MHAIRICAHIVGYIYRHVCSLITLPFRLWVFLSEIFTKDL